MTIDILRLRQNLRLSQPAKYVSVGLVSYGVDLGILFLCWYGLTMPLWLATSAGFWSSFAVNFLLSRRWTFGLRHRPRGAELLRYSALVAANYVVTIQAVTTLHGFGVPVVVARTVTLAVLTVSTFIIYSKWVFVKEDEPVADLSCCVCGSAMQNQETSWCYRCQECGTRASTLPIEINQDNAHGELDETRREAGLAVLRHDNLAIVTDRLVHLGLRPSDRVLDVGSAHGWFLRAATDRGLDAEGIEPDGSVAGAAQGAGRVRVGYFPEVLDPAERFEAMTFNDVLEHLPDADAAVAACVRHLSPGGLLSINIPNSRGLFFAVARWCRWIGLRSAFDRLWQVGLPFPHLWYFDRSGLIRLCERHGLRLAQSATLDSVRRKGLWQRAHIDRRPSITSVLGVAGVWILAPLLNAPAASDIIHLVFRAPVRH